MTLRRDQGLGRRSTGRGRSSTTLLAGLVLASAAGGLAWTWAPDDAPGRVPAPVAVAAAGPGAVMAVPASAPTTVARRWGPEHFPDVELTDQYGRKHRLYRDLLQGRTVAANTFFAGCSDVCPLSTAKMLELQALLGDRVGRDIAFYSFSVDPQQDTPATMKAYADRFGVGPGWLFLTGALEDVERVTRSLGLGSRWSNDARDNHSTTLMVGREPTGQWMKHSSTDNPRFVAASMATFLGWQVDQRQPGYSAAREMDVSNGRYLFNNGCSSCHTIGQGDRIGPDLAGVSARRPRDWLMRFILVPDQVIAAGDPVATALVRQYRGVRMPNLGLAREEVEDILDHIELTGNARQQAAARPAQAPATR